MGRAQRQILALVAACYATGCSSYAGSARAFSPGALETDRGWIAVRDVPVVMQRGEAGCGPAAIGMVVSYWTGRDPGPLVAQLRASPTNGIKAVALRDVARRHGLAAFLIRGELADLEHELRKGRPVLVGLVKPQRRGVVTHFEVVVALHPARGVVVTLDPAEGWRRNTVEGFTAEWAPSGYVAVVVAAARAPSSTSKTTAPTP